MLYSKKVMFALLTARTLKTTATPLALTAAQEQHQQDWQERAFARKDVTGP